jgi:hypothetical protein
MIRSFLNPKHSFHVIMDFYIKTKKNNNHSNKHNDLNETCFNIGIDDNSSIWTCNETNSNTICVPYLCTIKSKWQEFQEA